MAKDVIVAGGFHRGRERSKGKEEERGAREGSGGGRTKRCLSCSYSEYRFKQTHVRAHTDTHRYTPHGVKAERGLYGGRKGASMGWRGPYGGKYEQSSKMFVDKNVKPVTVYT